MNLHTPVLISHLTAREILDSRGIPTLECTCHLTNGKLATSSIPSGASTGSQEALELRDADPKRYWGQGVLTAKQHLTEIISPLVSGEDPTDQTKLDQLMINRDGTAQKKHLGGNTLLAASLAIAKAGAVKKRVELFQHFADLANNDHSLTLPIPMFNVINGGAHADMAVDFQEFMIVPNPLELTNYPDQLMFGSTLVHNLKQVLKDHHLPTAIGDEGGYAPQLKTNLEPLELLKAAGVACGFPLGQSFYVSLDLAANTYFKADQYHLRDFKTGLSQSSYTDYLLSLLAKYPIYSLEDPFPETAWTAWSHLVVKVPKTVVIVADDLTVTNARLLEQALKVHACTGIIIKPNQVGTLTETLAVIELAKTNGLTTIFSHRSGETIDPAIADLAVGCGADGVKFGAPIRGERVAKYNRLLQIFDALNE